MPSQFLDDEHANFVNGMVGSVYASSQVVIGGSFTSNLILNASLIYLWTFINAEQLIILLSLFYLSMPANMLMFYQVLQRLSTFEYFPTDPIYEYLDLNGGDPV